MRTALTMAKMTNKTMTPAIDAMMIPTSDPFNGHLEAHEQVHKARCSECSQRPGTRKRAQRSRLT